MASSTTSSTSRHPLAAALRILQNLGNAGRYVWGVSKGIEDLSERLAYLARAIDHLKSRVEYGADRYIELPVDVRTFVESPDLLNMRDEVYPKVLLEIQEMCSGRYVEAVLTGGIGSGKTTVALIATAYALYELACLKSPHREFGLAASSEIVFIFQNLNKNLARDVDYKRFKAMIDGSVFFKDVFPYDRGIESELQFPKRVFVRPVTGSTTAAIGQNVFGGVLDEVNFMAVIENSKSTVDGGTFDQARELYNAISRRRESRFMTQGRLPGMLCLVSSKQYPGEFTDKRIEAARTNPTIFVYDKRVWEIKPDGTFSGEWFKIFIGDESRKPRILDDGEVIEPEDRDLIMDIPLEYLPQFQEDMLAALRDIAGVSTTALHPFILNPDAVSKCFDQVPSIATREDCDFANTKLELYPKRVHKPEEPRFAHVDLGLTGDAAGFAMGHVIGFMNVTRGDDVETLPVIRYDLIVQIRPPRGGEIEFENVRRLVYAIRGIGVNLRWVTFDSWQSVDSLQILSRHGVVTGQQSMDTSMAPYDVMKQAFYDSRIVAPKHTVAMREILRLERDFAAQKIDHPPNGSKDCADAIAGVAYGLTMQRRIWARHGVPASRIPQRLISTQNTGSKSISRLDRFREELENA